MADIFISYKSEDREWAQRLDTLIRSAGYTTWWDTSLQTGDRYNDEIDRQLKKAKATVVIWSARSWVSTWVKEEALFSRDRDILLPTRIDDVEIGVPFYSLHTIDLRTWNGELDSPLATKLLESLEQRVPRKLKEDYSINVYWTSFNDKFVGDPSIALRFLERVKALCETIGVNIQPMKAWDHIVNPHTIADRSVYEQDLNILLYFGNIVMGGFAEDVFCPGLRKFARELNPYVLHIGHEKFSLDNLNFYCLPQRQVATPEPSLPVPDTMLGDSVVESLASHIAFRVAKVRTATAVDVE